MFPVSFFSLVIVFAFVSVLHDEILKVRESGDICYALQASLCNSHPECCTDLSEDAEHETCESSNCFNECSMIVADVIIFLRKANVSVIPEIGRLICRTSSHVHKCQWWVDNILYEIITEINPDSVCRQLCC